MNAKHGAGAPRPASVKSLTPIAVPAVELHVPTALCKPILRRSVRIDDLAAAGQPQHKRPLDTASDGVPTGKHGKNARFTYT